MLEKNKKFLAAKGREGTKADRTPEVAPHAPTRPTTMQEATQALVENNYPAWHITCSEDMAKIDLLTFAQAITTNRSLTSIDLANNVLDRDIQEALLDAVSVNKNIMSVTGMNPEPFIDYSERRTLATNINAVTKKNEQAVEALADNITSLKTLFAKPHDEIKQTMERINNQQAALYQKLQTAQQNGELPYLGQGGVEQLFDVVNVWARSKCIPAPHLDIPTAPVEALEGLPYEKPPLAPVTHIHTDENVSEGRQESQPHKAVSAAK